MPSLQFSVARALLRHQKLFNNLLFPYLETLHPYAVRHIFRHRQYLVPYVLGDKHILTLEQGIQKAVDNKENPSVAFQALHWLQWMDKRLSHLNSEFLRNADYQFHIGEICSVPGTRERVVVAMRFPVLMSEERHPEGEAVFTLDKPWYIVLLSHSQNQSKPSERLVPEYFLQKVKSPVAVGFNPRLPVFFRGYDMSKGAYVPRESIGESRENTQYAELEL